MSLPHRNNPLPRSHTPTSDSFYFFEGLYARLVFYLLPWFAKKSITPNQVTIANIANALLIVVCVRFELWLLASLLIQAYLFLDTLDGSLARYTQLSSRSGKLLDQVTDHLFYTLGFMAIGYYCGNTIFSLFVYAIALNACAWITSYHIAPRMRALPHVDRSRLEKWFANRKLIFGMDATLQCVIASLLLLSIWRPLILPLITLLYSAELVYRLMQLRRNEAKYSTSI